MRFPYHLFSASTFRSEPWLAAMAAVAIGMFVGAWLIGPAITRTTTATCRRRRRASGPASRT